MPELELSEEEGGGNYKLWPAIAGGRASASLPSVIRSCQTKCKQCCAARPQSAVPAVRSTRGAVRRRTPRSAGTAVDSTSVL